MAVRVLHHAKTRISVWKLKSLRMVLYDSRIDSSYLQYNIWKSDYFHCNERIQRSLHRHCVCMSFITSILADEFFQCRCGPSPSVLLCLRSCCIVLDFLLNLRIELCFFDSCDVLLLMWGQFILHHPNWNVLECFRHQFHMLLPMFVVNGTCRCDRAMPCLR